MLRRHFNKHGGYDHGCFHVRKRRWGTVKPNSGWDALIITNELQIGVKAKSWQDAQSICQEAGANLASIHNDKVLIIIIKAPRFSREWGLLVLIAVLKCEKSDKVGHKKRLGPPALLTIPYFSRKTRSFTVWRSGMAPCRASTLAHRQETMTNRSDGWMGRAWTMSCTGQVLILLLTLSLSRFPP